MECGEAMQGIAASGVREIEIELCGRLLWGAGYQWAQDVWTSSSMAKYKCQIWVNMSEQVTNTVVEGPSTQNNVG